MSEHEFNPDWVVHPGATLSDCMEEKGLDAADVFDAGLTQTELRGLYAGTLDLTPEIAGKLHALTGVSVDFWLSMERVFREGLAAGKTWTSRWRP